MHRLTVARYYIAEIPIKAPKKVKANIKPVKIDFPLPDQITGIEKRINTKNTFLLPEKFYAKNEPEFLIGKNVRLRQLLDNSQPYVNQIITVSGWAREARLAAKDTILFVKLVDGSNTIPLQVVIEKTVPNWEELKKAKIGYSFKITGRVEKSIGKGQSVELKLKG